MRGLFSLSTLVTVVLTLFVFFVGIALYGLFVGTATISIGSDTYTRSFSVDAEGRVEVVPNEFNSTFTVQESGATQEEAQNAGNSKQNEAIESLKNLGYADEDIKTTQYSIYPEYDYSVIGEPTPSGYQFTQSTTITSKDRDVMQKTLDALTPIGINIGGISFDVDQEEFMAEATELAVENAKLKAEELAEAGGFRVGKIISLYQYSDQQGQYPYPIEARSSMPGAEFDSSVISPGTDEVVSKVSITYSIR